MRFTVHRKGWYPAQYVEEFRKNGKDYIRVRFANRLSRGGFCPDSWVERDWPKSECEIKRSCTPLERNVALAARAVKKASKRLLGRALSMLGTALSGVRWDKVKLAAVLAAMLVAFPPLALVPLYYSIKEAVRKRGVKRRIKSSRS